MDINIIDGPKKEKEDYDWDDEDEDWDDDDEDWDDDENWDEEFLD